MVFVRESPPPSKRFAVNEKINNRLVQDQVIMAGCVEQTNRIPFFFLVLFLPYSIWCCQEEHHYSYWQVRDAFRPNNYGHIATIGRKNVHLIFHFFLRTLNKHDPSIKFLSWVLKIWYRLCRFISVKPLLLLWTLLYSTYIFKKWFVWIIIFHIAVNSPK